ncbi:hypothetical protein [Bradyrhizobium centrosematis]|uniref:hypothetical protein n=1 Tax=Bradyrhizobium centrosematis TaxID=1300039 RepID=UPI002168BA93|nr:hypothetical protein [Bradyrhizobium centrosematis]MCS3761652.1 hypothetical protein [Bradyrhizobium centrosematis]MCS3774320.1 hypothetical protein [Bradyrhizobium centrosematis]
MIAAEAYVYLKSEISERPSQERFASLFNEIALDAARRFIGDCEVEVLVEDGSTKAKARIAVTIAALLPYYGAIADFDSFCKQIGVWYSNVDLFLNSVAQRVKYGEVPNTTYERRIERRHKTTGKLKQVAEMVLDLNDTQHLLTAEQYEKRTEELIIKLGEIQREVSEEEMRHLLKVLSLERFNGPTKQPLDIFTAPSVLYRPRSKEEEESHQFKLEIEAQDAHHVGETRVVPIPKPIFERNTTVRKEEPRAHPEVDRPAHYPPTRQLDLD